MKQLGYGRFQCVSEYVAVFRALPRSGTGETPRHLAKSLKILLRRIDEVCKWLHEHGLAQRECLGTRMDPHEHDRRVPVYTYRTAAGATEEMVHAQIRECAKRPCHDDGWDCSGLTEAWKGVGPCP